MTQKPHHITFSFTKNNSKERSQNLQLDSKMSPATTTKVSYLKLIPSMVFLLVTFYWLFLGSPPPQDDDSTAKDTFVWLAPIMASTVGSIIILICQAVKNGEMMNDDIDIDVGMSVVVSLALSMTLIFALFKTIGATWAELQPYPKSNAFEWVVFGFLFPFFEFCFWCLVMFGTWASAGSRLDAQSRTRARKSTLQSGIEGGQTTTEESV